VEPLEEQTRLLAGEAGPLGELVVVVDELHAQDLGLDGLSLMGGERVEAIGLEAVILERVDVGGEQGRRVVEDAHALTVDGLDVALLRKQGECLAHRVVRTPVLLGQGAL